MENRVRQRRAWTGVNEDRRKVSDHPALAEHEIHRLKTNIAKLRGTLAGLHFNFHETEVADHIARLLEETK